MYKEYKTVDKSAYKIRGEWDNEPDKVQFVDEETGLNCLIVRNSGGALCGYVGVPEGHPAYQKNYNDVNARVHGGLTFSDKCQSTPDDSHGICHIAKEGEDDIWWLGFDTAHLGDFIPAYDRMYVGTNDYYKNIAYVKNEIKDLARQLKDMEDAGKHRI